MAHSLNSGDNSRLCGRTAYRVFRFAAWWTAAVALFLVVLLASYENTASNELLRITFQVLGGILGCVGAFAGIIIFFGMLTYLLRLDHSSRKVFWLLMFLATAWFGSALYFFTVYRKQVCSMEAWPLHSPLSE